MSSVVISGDTSGAITLSAPAVSGTNTITLPAATGTVMVSGNMPAFSAYVGTAQSISASTYTKVACNTKEFDTASCYNTSTYRFTPNVAGYYQFNGQTENLSGGGSRIIVMFYKNGSVVRFGNDLGLPSGNWGNGAGMVVSSLIYCNGTTDYIEFYILDTGGQTIATGPVTSYFQGFLVRTA
jgi:hypothetical protein